MSLFQNQLEKRLHKVQSKKTLFEVFGPAMQWIGVFLGLWVLGVFGAVADAVVLFSMTYLAIQNFYVCVVFAVVIAGAMQIIFGQSAITTFVSYFRGDYQKEGFTWMMTVQAIFMLVIFAGTIFLSTESDKVVVAAADQVFVPENINSRDAEFDRKIERAEQQFQQKYNNYLAQYGDLKKEKVTDKSGQLVTRWSSNNAALSILNTTLPNMEKELADKVARYEAEKQKYQEEAKARNARLEEKRELRVSQAEYSVVGINVGINLARALALYGLAYFLAKAGKPTSAGTNTSQTNNASGRNGSQGGSKQLSSNNTGKTVKNEQIGFGSNSAGTEQNFFFNRKQDGSVVSSFDEIDLTPELQKWSDKGQDLAMDEKDKIEIIDGQVMYRYTKKNGEKKLYSIKGASDFVSSYKTRMNARLSNNKMPTGNQVERFSFWDNMVNFMDEKVVHADD